MSDTVFVCPNCGPGVSVDEDRTCGGCGADTFRSNAPWYVAELRAARNEGVSEIVTKCAKRFPNSTFWREWK